MSFTLPLDWQERLHRLDQTPIGQQDRHLFRELNPGQQHSPILASPPENPRQAAVMIPILDRTEGPSVLFTVRTKTLPTHAGEISFPGGSIDRNDDGPIAAALRETHEEVGISPDQIDVTSQLGVHFGGLGYAVTPVIGLIKTNVDLTPNEREVDEIFEVPLSHILNPNSHEVEQRQLGDVRYNMYAIPYRENNMLRHIWGLTAGIIHTFYAAFHEGGGNDG